MNLFEIMSLHSNGIGTSSGLLLSILITAQLSTAMGVSIIPTIPITMFLYLIGILGWLLVAYWWHDRALIVLNSIGAFIMASGIVKFYGGGLI
jgi:hypothetical protein